MKTKQQPSQNYSRSNKALTQVENDTRYATAVDSTSKPQSGWKDSWTEKRIERLFHKYNVRFWSGKLNASEIRFAVRHNRRAPHQGRHCTLCRLLEINLANVRSDADVRSTLLHEMAHVAAGPKSKGHDEPFFAQLEHILSKGAPITVGLAENEHRPSFENVSARFSLVREALHYAYARQAFRRRFSGAILRHIVLAKCGRWAYRGAEWRSTWAYVAFEHDLTDVRGRLLPVHGALRIAAHRAYRRMRDIVEGRVEAPGVLFV